MSLILGFEPSSRLASRYLSWLDLVPQLYCSLKHWAGQDIKYFHYIASYNSQYPMLHHRLISFHQIPTFPSFLGFKKIKPIFGRGFYKTTSFFYGHLGVLGLGVKLLSP